MNRAFAVMRLAEHCRATHRWTRAETLFRQAVAHNSCPATNLACGTYLAERQQHGDAIRYLIQGLDEAQSAGDLDSQASIFSSLATIYRELGDHDLARRFQGQVLAIHGAADAGDLLDWSADALLAGKTTLAETLARNAQELVQESEDIEMQADAFGLLGAIAARQGHLRRAVWLLIRAARGHQCVADEHGLATDYQNLAEVFGLMERYRWQHSMFAAAQAGFHRAGKPLSSERLSRRLRDQTRLDLYRRMDVRRN